MLSIWKSTCAIIVDLILAPKTAACNSNLGMDKLFSLNGDNRDFASVNEHLISLFSKFVSLMHATTLHATLEASEKIRSSL